MSQILENNYETLSKEFLNKNNLVEVSEGDHLVHNIQTSMQLKELFGLDKQANRLENCGVNFLYFMCGCGFIRTKSNCYYRVCEKCAKTRSNKFFTKFFNYIKSKRIARSIYDNGLRFLTLTIKNKANLEEAITD